MNRFSLKVAIVTGGSSGIGQEVATRLVQEGAKVVITGRDLDKLKAAAEQIDSTRQYIAYYAADIAEPNTAQQLINFTTEKFGGVDILINNAGIFAPKSFLDVTEAEYDAFLDIILKGKFFMAQAAALDKLKSAIDSARQRMKGLADDAKNTADSLEAALAKLQGNEDKARDIEQTKKLTELEEKLNEAKARGNSEEASQLNRALELQKQINREEDKKARADEATSNTAQTKNTQPPSNKDGASSTRTVDINLKFNGSNTKLTIPESQESAMMAFMRQLEESKALAGQ